MGNQLFIMRINNMFAVIYWFMHNKYTQLEYLMT